jgi:Tfp pilus assembly protein PilO
MPYSLSFNGDYFAVADFLKGLDDLIHTRGNSEVAANGRLLTIDGFSLSNAQSLGPNPKLSVSVAVTSYVTPSTQGLTAGASPSGPAPSTSTPQTQPASAAVSAP